MNNYVNVKKMSITLSKDTANELNIFAKEMNEKKSHIIEKALTYYFDLLEEKIADQRLKDLDEGKVDTIDAEDVWDELGL